MQNTQSYELIATCAFGLEAVVRRELESLCIDAAIGESGRVHFQGTAETVAFSQESFDRLMELAKKGIGELVALQKLTVT